MFCEIYKEKLNAGISVSPCKAKWTYLLTHKNIDKQYDKEERISDDIICPLISYNNYMSTPRKQRAVSPTHLSGRHIPVDPQKRQYMLCA